MEGEGGDEDCADAALLAPLTEDSFVENLRVRFLRDSIYTYVGDAVVALNPGRALPLYSAELVRAYAAGGAHRLPPHVYAAAAGAWRRARDLRRPQAVLVTGESGAGKTEAARLCLQCALLAAGAPPPPAAAALAAQGTLLEAFGNAATQRNHNASRFGKLLELELGLRGEPLGGHVTHYLLEKERAYSVLEGERNFHVLYQLLAGADVPLLKRLKLQRSWEQYRILRAAPPSASPRRGGSPRAPPPPPPPAAPRDDADHFAHTTHAMRALGLRRDERERVLRLLAFLLKLGNVHFEPQHDIDGSIATRIHRVQELREACALVGVDAEELAAALTAPHPDADVEGDSDEEEDSDADSEARAGCAEWARGALERLLAATYSRLFAWLVRRANEALRAPAAEGGAQLALLDMYGLESLARNTLQRLAVNYAAERVQAAVTGATLRREQDEYAREGLAWRPLPFRDTEPLVAALDRLVLPALPARRLLPRLRAAARAAPHHAAHLRLRPPHRFQVEHYGGWVEYSAAGMAAAERDAWCGRCGAALAGAACPLLAALWAGGGGARAAGGLLQRQRALVGALVRRLPAQPRLVRCVRADLLLRARRWDAGLVRSQVAAQGLVELARLRRAGWAHSECARALLRRYWPLGAPGTPQDASSAAAAVEAARALLLALPLPPAEFSFGRTRVFVRSPRTVWELEELRAARVRALVVRVQRAWRARAARGGGAGGAGDARAAAAARLWAWWCTAARRRYLAALWARLPARHRSPACEAWPPAPQPLLLARADRLLRAAHHAWRCRLYRAALDRPARNRLREKATASALFRGRKASYARGVAHPFVGDYVRVRASGAWRRAADAQDAYVVFADVCGEVRAHGGTRRRVCVLSTAALLVLEARSLRVRRRVCARAVRSLALSPHADDALAVRVRPEPAGAAEAACLPPRRAAAGDLLLRTAHPLELATKLFLVVQNAVGAAPPVEVGGEWWLRLGAEEVRVCFHQCGGEELPRVRLLRRAQQLDVLLEPPALYPPPGQ